MGGFTWTGMFSGRKIDVLGLGITYAHFSGETTTRDADEIAIETFYRIRFTEAFSLKPDLQYIIHPGGSGLTSQPLRRDALVLDLRADIAF
jgi:porin